jgi:sarcosine oxidase subunit gamma
MPAVTDELREASPLAGFAPRFAALRGVALVERSLAQIDLRGDPGDAAFRAAVRRALGGDVPTEPNTAAAAADGRAVLWLGPDEWLVVGAGDPAALTATLTQALAGLHAAAVDISASRAVIELAGPQARAVIEKGCGLDLHPRSFAAGRCAQSVLARAQVIIHQVADTPTYRLFVRASFAAYLAGWLLDAAREYEPA